MKQLIFDDICLKLDDLRIPYTQDDKYILVSTAFYDVGCNVEPKKVLYELSVFVDEASRSVSMYVKTADEYLLETGSGNATASSGSIFRKVRHISYNGAGEGSVTTINLGEVPNTVKNTAIKYGWKFRTALNLNRAAKRVQRPPVVSQIAPEPIIEPEPPEPVCAPPAAVSDAADDKKLQTNFLRRLFNRGKYAPRH